MNQNTKYLLLLDPKPEVLSLQETALRCFYKGEVLTLDSSVNIAQIFAEKGHPELVIADSRMLMDFHNESFSVPLIATVSPGHDSIELPEVTAILEKPLSVTSFTYLVKSITSEMSLHEPSHVPVKTTLLLRKGISFCDLYLKLSEKNLVKVLHKGEIFSENDFRKMTEKNVFELFIRVEDSKEFLNELEKELSGPGHTLEDVTFAIENIESLEKIVKTMRWSPSVLVIAQRSVAQAVKILSKNQNVIAQLKHRLAQPSSTYSRHIGLLSYMVCAFSSSIGMTGESGQIKLALAALIHDAAVDEEYYPDIKEWNRKAADPNDKSPETLKYRMHPYEGSKIVKSLDSHSPDVDQIILQHHELKNGAGFPRGLDSHRIGYLPALFIIVEDLVEFLGDGENIETSIVDFITWGRAYYDAGHFKKIFQAFEENLKRP